MSAKERRACTRLICDWCLGTRRMRLYDEKTGKVRYAPCERCMPKEGKKHES